MIKTTNQVDFLIIIKDLKKAIKIDRLKEAFLNKIRSP